jgi:hypothetical protein
MGSEKEKGEIIELTDVLEEGPALPAGSGRPERPSGEAEERFPPARPAAAGEPRIGPADMDPGAMREILTRQAAAWLAGEGAQIVERIARELFPQIAEKALSREIEKLREESRAPEKE